MDCDRIRELLDAYVLDALEPDERDEVRRHLETCEHCRRDVELLAEMVATFPEALAGASPITVPDEVGQRLMQAVANRVGQRQDEVSSGESPGNSGTQRPKPARRHHAWRWLATAAPLVLLLISLIWGFRLVAALDRERDLRAEYVALIDQVVGQQELVFEVIGFDDTERLFLSAQQPDSTSYGKVFTRPTMPYVVVMAGRLPDLPAGQAFHVWLVSDAGTTHAGELTVDANGFGILLYTADQPGPMYSTAYVTLRPAGDPSPGGTEILRHEPPAS